MLVICCTKSDIGYNPMNSGWVIINEEHHEFQKMMERGYKVRDADYLEEALFNTEHELDENVFGGCGHPTHFPGPMDRGHFNYICAKCGHETRVRSGI